jgi:hypothetical protein
MIKKSNRPRRWGQTTALEMATAAVARRSTELRTALRSETPDAITLNDSAALNVTCGSNPGNDPVLLVVTTCREGW